MVRRGDEDWTEHAPRAAAPWTQAPLRGTLGRSRVRIQAFPERWFPVASRQATLRWHCRTALVVAYVVLLALLLR